MRYLTIVTKVFHTKEEWETLVYITGKMRLHPNCILQGERYRIINTFMQGRFGITFLAFLFNIFLHVSFFICTFAENL